MKPLPESSNKDFWNEGETNRITLSETSCNHDWTLVAKARTVECVHCRTVLYFDLGMLDEGNRKIVFTDGFVVEF